MGHVYAIGIWDDAIAQHTGRDSIFWRLGDPISNYRRIIVASANLRPNLGSLLVIVKSFHPDFCADVGQMDLTKAQGGSTDELIMEIFDPDFAGNVVCLRFVEMVDD